MPYKYMPGAWDDFDCGIWTEDAVEVVRNYPSQVTRTVASNDVSVEIEDLQDSTAVWNRSRSPSLHENDFPSTPKCDSRIHETTATPSSLRSKRSDASIQDLTLTAESLSLETPKGIQKKDVSLQDKRCADCKEKGPDRFFCNICGYVLCNVCWERPLQHRLEPGENQVLHEKTDLDLAERIEKALRPKRNPEEDTQLHKDDENAIWFGTVKDEKDLDFLDKERYADLIAECSYGKRMGKKPSDMTPSLVSFIGQTGAGKSSLINLIITLSQGKEQDFAKPVVGSSGDCNLPTSGDVHLYQDPKSAHTQSPMLYADCEGLQGGDSAPTSEVLRKGVTGKSGSAPSINTHRIVKYVSGKLRKLFWLKDKDEKLGSRQFIVENLYARILYTFSDVVVFVLKESRTIEVVVLQLLEWASKAIESSSNQASLPHAIIVLNMAPNTLVDSDWSIKNSTQWLFKGLDQDINNNARFEKYIKSDPSKERRRVTTEVLLQDYYSTIKVVRMPELADGSRRPHLIENQVCHLYYQISINCKAARDKKRKLRMLLNAEQFNPYLQFAFNHFSSADGLDKPFDFIQASFLDAAVQPDFKSNICTVAEIMLKKKLPLTSFLDDLGNLIASCIMFESTRNSRIGLATKLLPQYSQFFEPALDNILLYHWPCQGRVNNLKCINMSRGHAKGHQNEKGVFEPGEYEPKDGINFAHAKKDFRNKIGRRVQELFDSLEAMKNRNRNLVTHNKHGFATHLHRESLRKLFTEYSDNHPPQDLGDKSRLSAAFDTGLISHSACLLCLVGQARYTLACGHVICNPCANSFGVYHGKTLVEVQECPLDGKRSTPGTMIVQKPPLAGVRILSIDGGGIRGILQLTLLRLLEEELGGKIPIQCFFDLVAGTSVGGIITLGLFRNGWSTEKSIHEFKSLCGKAFTGPTGMEIFDNILYYMKNLTWRFSTSSLESALKEAFTDSSLLLGGSGLRQESQSFGANVVVTACSKGGGACIFTNYNRVEPENKRKLSYSLIREQIPGRGIKTWEAARATSAAPTWFKHFAHQNSGRTFLDGGLYHNNPVKITALEQDLIWPNCVIDLNLSLGCGQEQKPDPPTETPESQSWLEWVKDKIPGRQMWLLGMIAVDHLENSLNSEQTWNNFYNSQTVAQAEKCLRLNTPLGSPFPELHDFKKIPPLEAITKDYWSGYDQRRVIKDLASRLLASSFYFDLHEQRDIEQGKVAVKGEILCRFSHASPRQEVKRLGEHFSSMKTDSGDGKLYFLVLERGAVYSHMFSLSDQVLQQMITEGVFSLTTTPFELQLNAASSTLEILLCFGDDESEKYAISGFPRALREDNSSKT